MTTPVPFEFLGLGRRFREQIAEADDLCVGTMVNIFTPLATRADRSRIPRPELLQAAKQQWRQMPTIGLLDSQIQLLRRTLHIREVRIGAGTSCDPQNKGDPEPVIVILLVDLHVAPGRCQLMIETAALVSLHALGRWYQRSIDSSEVALNSDLIRLTEACGQILDDHAATGDPNFRCRTAYGQWAGLITRRLSEVTDRQERVLNVRTFLSNK
jgi:hypothetical protein